MIVCMTDWYTLAHNTAENSSDNLPYYLPDNHHCSKVVYLRQGAYCKTLTFRHILISNFWSVENLWHFSFAFLLLTAFCLSIFLTCWLAKLCDPHLSALEVRFSRRCALQIDVYLYLYLVKNIKTNCPNALIVGRILSALFRYSFNMPNLIVCRCMILNSFFLFFFKQLRINITVVVYLLRAESGIILVFDEILVMGIV